MGIIYDDIYKEYFPVKTTFTFFTEQEKIKLCQRAKTFRKDVEANLINRIQHNSKMGIQYVPTYDLNEYKETDIIEMIMNNHFDDKGLIELNCIIYSHKYNSLLSLLPFLSFPILTKKMLQTFA